MSDQAHSYYDILGVSQSASQQDIMRAYRKLVMIHHPDRAAINKLSTTQQRFHLINEAYSALKTPTRRAAYDEKLTKAQTQTLRANNDNVWSNFSRIFWPKNTKK